MLVRVSRPKSAASGVLQRGHYPHPHSRHAGSSGRYPEPSVRQFSDTAGGGRGGRHTPDVWRGQLGCTDTQQQLHCTTGHRTNWWYWDTGTGDMWTMCHTGAQEHLRSSLLQLETKVREDFTITEKASTRAFYP